MEFNHLSADVALTNIGFKDDPQIIHVLRILQSDFTLTSPNNGMELLSLMFFFLENSLCFMETYREL